MKPSDLAYQALAHARGGLDAFEDRYGDAISDIHDIWHRLAFEQGLGDLTAAMLAVAVYQVNAPEPHQEQQ